MARTLKLYGKGILRFATGEIAWKASGGSSFKVALLKSSYTFNQDTHEKYADLDVASNEVTGTNYAPGGEFLVLKDPIYDADSNEVRLLAHDVEWNGLTLNDSAKYAVIYCISNNYLVGCLDLDEAVSVSDKTLIIKWDNAGCLKFTVSA